MNNNSKRMHLMPLEPGVVSRIEHLLNAAQPKGCNLGFHIQFDHPQTRKVSALRRYYEVIPA